MATERLKAFLRRKKAELTTPNVSWSIKRDQYLASVERLYDLITHDYLGALDDEELVRIDRLRSTTISEPFVGAYPVPVMMLYIGGQRVTFRPKGVMVVGSSGRLDVVGIRRTARLIRDNHDVWFWRYSRDPRFQMVPLDEATFLDILQRVML